MKIRKRLGVRDLKRLSKKSVGPRVKAIVASLNFSEVTPLLHGGN